ncbi:hypothetical protein J7L02_03185 [Candidatus Woesearchaeota archaeon]|nr:hypothetical protein [Candidatus Woesearchaeota archaeon]
MNTLAYPKYLYKTCEQLKFQEVITNPEQHIYQDNYQELESVTQDPKHYTSFGKGFSLSLMLLKNADKILKFNACENPLIFTATTSVKERFARQSMFFYDKENMFTKKILMKAYQTLTLYKEKNLDLENLKQVEKAIIIPLNWPSIPWHLVIEESLVKAEPAIDKNIAKQICKDQGLEHIIESLTTSMVFNGSEFMIQGLKNSYVVKAESFYDASKAKKRKCLKLKDFEMLKHCCARVRDLEFNALHRFLNQFYAQHYAQQQGTSFCEQETVQKNKFLEWNNSFNYFGRKSSFEAGIARKLSKALGKELKIIGGDKGSLQNVLKKPYRHEVFKAETHNSSINMFFGALRYLFKIETVLKQS